MIRNLNNTNKYPGAPTQPSTHVSGQEVDIYGPAAGVKGQSSGDTKEGRCRHLSVYGLLPTCKLKLAEARWIAACVYSTSRGERPQALMLYAPLLLIGLAASVYPGYSQVWQGTVLPTRHQPRFALARVWTFALTPRWSSCSLRKNVY
jgi:hypothetical protein